MKLVATLACRNQSSRLYAKPLQNLDVEHGVTILDFMISQIKLHPLIQETVLAISENKENSMYEEIAKRHGIPYVWGDDRDVLARLIKAGHAAGASDILRVTTESPYIYYDNLHEVYEHHTQSKLDYSTTSGLPEGTYYEIIRLSALEKSWECGGNEHRSELCSLYIFQNQDRFGIKKHACKDTLKRPDIRLTVDWPEDLIVMREVYKGANLDPGKKVDLERIVRFLDDNPKINAVNNWIDAGTGRIWY